MVIAEKRTRVVACWGRLADALTREGIAFRRFTAVLTKPDGIHDVPEYKDDGHFAFADVENVAMAVTIDIEGLGYARRTISQALSTSPVELTYAGEDELYVLVNQIQTGTRRVTFDAISFLPSVPAGAVVLGTGGFSTALSNDVGGAGVQAVTLDTVTGLAVDTTLRVVRSRRLLLRPGPTYPFATDQTLIDLTVLADATGEPIAGATATIDRVNGASLTTDSIGGLTLQIALPLRLVMGPTDIEARTDGRGRAVFYYPPTTGITLLRFSVAAPDFVTLSLDVPVVQRTRTARTVRLVRA